LCQRAPLNGFQCTCEGPALMGDEKSKTDKENSDARQREEWKTTQGQERN